MMEPTREYTERRANPERFPSGKISGTDGGVFTNDLSNYTFIAYL